MSAATIVQGEEGVAEEPPWRVVRAGYGDDTSNETVALSPYDFLCGGRSVPMIWFFDTDELEAEKLCAALEQALRVYPVMSGRYADRDEDVCFPAAIRLCDEGVPVWLGTAEDSAADYVAPFASSSKATEKKLKDSFTVFDRSDHAKFLPPKLAGMDPDAYSPSAPLLAAKITVFGGKTALAILFQHAVIDAEAAVKFVQPRQFGSPPHLGPFLGGDHPQSGPGRGSQVDLALVRRGSAGSAKH